MAFGAQLTLLLRGTFDDLVPTAGLLRVVDDGDREEDFPAPTSTEQFAWYPQKGPQKKLLGVSDRIMEVVLGGARGGGKTDGMLGDWQSHAIKFGERANGVFFRRTAKQLEEVVARSKQIYPLTGAIWRKQDATWEWVSGRAKGARLRAATASTSSWSRERAS